MFSTGVLVSIFFKIGDWLNLWMKKLQSVNCRPMHVERLGGRGKLIVSVTPEKKNL